MKPTLADCPLCARLPSTCAARPGEPLPPAARLLDGLPDPEPEEGASLVLRCGECGTGYRYTAGTASR